MKQRTNLGRWGIALALSGASLLLLLEAAWIYDRRAKANEGERTVRRCRADLQRLQMLVPKPTRGSEAAIEAEIARLRTTLATIQAAWAEGETARRFAAAAAPAGRAEAYFDLAAFVERMRERTREHDVEVGPEAARFGFASYANGGPDAASIERVFRQRLVAEYLVETLCAARPKILLAVKRERLEVNGENGAAGRRARENYREAAGDFFALDPGSSAGASAGVTTSAFQLSFVGQTATLRDFMNRLASFDLPVTVRAVEVEPANFEAKARSNEAAVAPASASSYVLTAERGVTSPTRAQAAKGEAVPLVPKPFSRFTVTLEHVRLREPRAGIAARTDATTIANWKPPPAQARGAEWVYDAFTPPEIFYHARTKQFAVKPPEAFVNDASTAEAFGLEVIAVRREPFRLQLIGYVGAEGAWRGTFQNGETGEIVVAGPQCEFAALDLEVRTLDVRLQPVALPDSMTTNQRIATAVVHDRRTGRDVVLTHRERQAGEKAFALVVAGDATREVREGETVIRGEAVYRIEKIRISPAAVEVAMQTRSGAETVRRHLTPRHATGDEGQ